MQIWCCSARAQDVGQPQGPVLEPHRRGQRGFEGGGSCTAGSRTEAVIKAVKSLVERLYFVRRVSKCQPYVCSRCVYMIWMFLGDPE